MQALKVHKESGEHKQKIVMYITLKGIRIVDEKTQVGVTAYHLWKCCIGNYMIICCPRKGKGKVALEAKWPTWPELSSVSVV